MATVAVGGATPSAMSPFSNGAVHQMEMTMYADTVMVRRARTLVFDFEGRTLSAFNFLNRRSSIINPVGFAILSHATDWMPVSYVVQALQMTFGPEATWWEMGCLIEAGSLVTAGTTGGAADAAYEKKWAWGPTAAHYHFAIRDTRYLSREAATGWMSMHVATTPPVPLYQTNDGMEKVVKLPAPRADGIFAVIKQRRSFRGFEADPAARISLESLRDCLFSGLGIVGFATADQGRIPLKTTPSGGGRNPYEAYVYSRKVAQLDPGIYHYSAVDNSLGLIRGGGLPDVGDLLAEQPWFNNAAATIFLVAHFERTMWKYPHPTGFRVVLLEAGHIAQNMLLAATENGLASTPTCAVSDSLLQEVLGLDPVLQAVIYTVSIGVRGCVPTIADVSTIEPNRAID